MSSNRTFLKVTHGQGALRFHSLVNLSHIIRVIVDVSGKVTLELSNDSEATVPVNEPAEWFEDIISGHSDDVYDGIYEYKG